MAASAARSREAAARFPGGLLAIDYFGDTDLMGASRRGPVDVTVVSIRRDFGFPRSTASLVRAALRSEWSSLSYTGGLENRPAALRLLARRAGVRGERHVDGSRSSTVLGNDGAIVAAVRDPRRLFPFLAIRGIPHARVRFDAADAARAGAAAACLIKRVRSAGGGGVRAASPGERRRPGEYFQEYLEGPVGSAAFVADGRNAVLLGVTEQLIGWDALAASGFRYCGNIAGPADAFLSSSAHEEIARAAGRITERFGLRGLNGLDYVVHHGVPRIIEVNPRWTASMELVEERRGENLFDLHLRACERQPALPAPEAEASRRALVAPRLLAKGILYASRACAAPAPQTLEALGARDRPARDELILPGQPICSLMASGADVAACKASLVEMANAVRESLR